MVELKGGENTTTEYRGPEGLEKEWRALEIHLQALEPIHVRQLFEQKDRKERFSISAVDLALDFSKQRVTEETMSLLFNTAREANVEGERDAMFDGQKVNRTENRPAGHVALRYPQDKQFVIDGQDAMPKVRTVLERMGKFSDEIRSGERKGYTGKIIKDIVVLGTGGSIHGPKMGNQALSSYVKEGISFHFISNVDGTDFERQTKDLDREETLFMIASKSLDTQETMENAFVAREWTLKERKDKDGNVLSDRWDKSAIAKHFVALSANIEKVEQFGIDPSNMFEFWDFVGGRYSLPSAIGLSLMIGIGKENFTSMLEGYHAMDMHFKETRLEENMPVIMGLLQVWNINFLKTPNHAILPYAQDLELLISYLQQLMMESDGKSVTESGKDINYDTIPAIGGLPGSNYEHSIGQALAQGTQITSVDFIRIKKTLGPEHQHEILESHLDGWADALAFGKTVEELLDEGVSKELAPHKRLKGNRPSNTLSAPELSPKVLGELISLYEHVTFVMAKIWKINPFDQEGVEDGKRRSRKKLEGN